MANFTIWHDRPGCIGCAACANVTPQYWEMKAPDGKSDLIGSKQTLEGSEIKKEELDVDSLDGNKEAAESCPVNVIHLIDKKTGKQII